MFLLSIILLSSCISYTPAPRPISLVAKSFISIEEKTTYTVCKDKTCTIKISESLSGGFVVGQSKEGSIALMTAHACDPDVGPFTLKTTEIKAFDYNSVQYDTEILKIMRGIDTCVILVKDANLPQLYMARSAPKIGDEVFTVSTPHGIRSTNMIPLFSGYYSGLDKELNMDVYTLPVDSGSSGGPIIDKNGHVLGLVSKKPNFFEHILYSPRYGIVNLIYNLFKNGITDKNKNSI